MSIQSEIADKFIAKYPTSVVKKLDRDNHLDIHVPEIHEKKGTHIFFNTSKNKIKIGFYCRDEEFVTRAINNSVDLLERYSQGLRLNTNPVFDSVDEALVAAFNLVEILIGKITEKDTSKSMESEVEDSDVDRGFPVISWSSDTTISQDFLKAYAKKWQVESELYNWRAGILGILPDWMEQLVDRDIFYRFSSSQIDRIVRYISEDYIIPVLDYVPEDLYMHTRRVWWIVPFCIWRNDTASFLFVDKNGIYSMFRDSENEIDTDMIFPWDRVEEIDFITGVDGDPNVVRLDVYSDSGGQLSFDEFVSDSKGSYLKVIESIYRVRKDTIEESKGAHEWYEGAGGEGFKSFSKPTDLLDEFKWLNPSRPGPEELEKYLKDEFKVKEWPNEFLIAVSLIADQKFGYCNVKGSDDDFYQILKHKLFDGEWDLFKDNWQKGLEIYKDIYAPADTWKGVYENLKNYFDEKIEFSSKLSEYKLASVFYEFWLYTASENVLQIDFEYDDLKPLMEISFNGNKDSGLPFGYMLNHAKGELNFIKNLYKIFGEKYLWRAFLSKLETPVQFVQIADSLALDGDYNHIDSETAEYVVTYGGYGSPQVNRYVLGSWDWYDKIKHVVKQNPAIIGSLYDADHGVEMTTRFIDEDEIEQLKSLVVPIDCKIKLKLDAEDLKQNSALDTLLFDLPSGNEISFKMWIFKNREYTYQDFFENLLDDKGWIEIIKNTFASKLINDANEYIFTTIFDDNEISGSDYLKNYAKWEIEVESNKYPTKCFLGQLQIGTNYTDNKTKNEFTFEYKPTYVYIHAADTFEDALNENYIFTNESDANSTGTLEYRINKNDSLLFEYRIPLNHQEEEDLDLSNFEGKILVREIFEWGMNSIQIDLDEEEDFHPTSCYNGLAYSFNGVTFKSGDENELDLYEPDDYEREERYLEYYEVKDNTLIKVEH